MVALVEDLYGRNLLNENTKLNYKQPSILNQSKEK